MIVLPTFRGVLSQGGAAPPPAAATIAFLQDTLDTVGRTTYTFSAQNLGSADSNRFIVASFLSRSSGTASRTISSVSIGGVSATVVQASNVGANRNVSALACAAVPSGTTGDVVVTLSGSMLRAAIQLYRVIGLGSATTFDSANALTVDPSVLIDVPAGGVAVGNFVDGSGLGSTWVGLDLDFSSDTSLRRRSASRAFASAVTDHVVSCNGGASEPTFLVASWGP